MSVADGGQVDFDGSSAPSLSTQVGDGQFESVS